MSSKTQVQNTEQEDAALYRGLQTLAEINELALMLVQVMARQGAPGRTEEQNNASIQQMSGLMQQIVETSKRVVPLQVMARLIVLMEAAAQHKHLVSVKLTVSKAQKNMHMKVFYGDGDDDCYHMLINANVAEQLRDGLQQGLSMLNPKPTIIIAGF